MSQVLKEKCVDSVSKQTQLNVSTNFFTKEWQEIRRYNLWFTKRDQVVQIVATGNCTTKIKPSSYRWSPDVVTLYVEPQFTTVYKRGHTLC